MKFKVGDKVRVIGNKYNVGYHRIGDLLTIKRISYNSHYKEFSAFFKESDYGLFEDDIELFEDTSNYITTKDFIKEVEKLGCELDIRTGVIFIKTKNFREVGWVRTDYECSAAFNFECDKLLLDIFYLYANTPLELREEPKKYTLELPNNDLSRRYYAQNKLIKEHYKFTIKSKGNNNTYKADFTQQEIDNLPNQELIKTLIQKEVEND